MQGPPHDGSGPCAWQTAQDGGLVAGGDEVIAALARERGKRLVGYAYLLAGNMRDAEDLVQDALVKTVIRSRAGTTLDAAEAYVRQAILTTFIDGRRRNRRWLDAVPLLGRAAPATVPDPAVLSTDQLHVREALATLPRRERACVVLRYYDDLPLADIAGQLGISVRAVKRYLSTGVHRLEGRLGPVDDDGRADDDQTRNVERSHP
ncbi:hypothetical protein AGMMS50218_14270 [Actinomycetota bacterium]|nr:hypothetical protein AGMMS50218_14270 [Actinomycetota bacterium]